MDSSSSLVLLIINMTKRRGEREGERRGGREERRGGREERRGGREEGERRGEERRGEERRDIPMVVLAPWPEMTIVWSGRGYSLSLIDFISKFLSPPHKSVLPTEPICRILLLYPSSPTSLADTFLLSLSFLSLSPFSQ